MSPKQTPTLAEEHGPCRIPKLGPNSQENPAPLLTWPPALQATR